MIEKMKKILYSFMLLFVAALCFTACSDDDGDNGSAKMPSNPGQDIAGVYTGTWKSVNEKTGAELTGEGTVTIVANDTAAYAAELSIAECKAVSLAAVSTMVNVTWSTDNVYRFYNSSLVNGLGVAFSSTVNGSSMGEFSFKKESGAGRNKKTYVYTFSGGTKQ